MARDLSGDLAAVEEIVGRECALKLARGLGGRRIYIPGATQGRSFELLSDLIGMDAAGRLVERMGRETVYIGHARKALVPWLADHGLLAREIADELRLSRESVRQYLRAERLARQGNLPLSSAA